MSPSPAEKPQRIEGLQLWLPSDSFTAEHNVTAYTQAMFGFEAISILSKPGEAPIYCSGTSRTIYHVVDETIVAQRALELENGPGPVTSIFQADHILEKAELPEEARARELHLGLGRTGLLLAINAEKREQFVSATADLERVLAMVNQRVHTLEDMSATPLNKMGLIYMYVQAARRHKTLSREAALKLAGSIDNALLPFARGRGSTTETWGEYRGRGFVDRVSFAQHQPKHTRKPSAPKKKARKPSTKGHVLHQPKSPEKTSKQRSEAAPRSKADTFISKLRKDRRPLSYSNKLKAVHELFLGEHAEPFEVRNETRYDMTRLAFSAYIDTMKLSDRDAAGQVAKFLAKKGGHSRRPYLPFLVIGNLMAAKANAALDEEETPIQLPGYDVKGIPDSFRAMRRVLAHSRPGGESEDIAKLADLAEAYLRAAFPPSLELSYEILEAPEDVVSTPAFAQQHRLSQVTLERLLGNYGIDPMTYRFGPYARKGLTPGDQAILLSALSELRVEPAPRGTRSVSAFAHISGTQVARIRELIAEHNIETGRHLFTTTVADSLSPEEQHKLAGLLGKYVPISDGGNQ